MTQKSIQLKTIVVRELPRLRRFAYSLTGSKADADDLVQNVVMRLLKSGVPDEDSAVPWMLRICKNCWIDEVRSRTVRTNAMNTMLNDTPEFNNDSEKLVMNQLEVERVIQAMDTLSDNQRIALSLVAIENLSYDEAAKVLEIPIGTIMSRVARARQNLHRILH